MLTKGQYVVIEEACMFGKNVRIGDFCRIAEGAVIKDNTWVGSYVRVGKYSNIGENCILKCKCIIPPFLAIGDRVFIGPGAMILYSEKDGEEYKSFIDDDVYIGANAVVRAGVMIAKKVIVGACSYVNRDLLEEGTYVGIPCRKIK